MFTIAAIALILVGAILISVVHAGRMPEGSSEILSGAVTGLLMTVQKVIDAQQQRRMAEQLHQSQPVDKKES